MKIILEYVADRDQWTATLSAPRARLKLPATVTLPAHVPPPRELSPIEAELSPGITFDFNLGVPPAGPWIYQARDRP
jgi:hypothetical protein